jgi:hypothetical protein
MTIGKLRRRLLVDPRFQSELISASLAVFVPATAVFWAITWAVLLEVEGLGQALGMPIGHPFFERLVQLRFIATAAIGVTLAGVIALVVYGGLVRTRRIAGPIHALRRQLEKAGRGEAESPVPVRQGDYFPDLLQSFNRWMVDRETDSR